ncbi:SDR family oxidoreductase [Pelagibius sp. Alg239-R121]|uniref:SDR family oxidoreductase n=1 Tax=Pelagibius sp. Alg239-R121 TaxID=2993448 RepID=UPI0024A6D802|nr:SDR family oxidoreductase [Pelagibius sp. Alg239-R121]
MTQLENKIVIITGASSGIGHAAAKLFAEEGAKLVVGARRQVELDTLVGEIRASGGQAIALAGDVREEAYAKALVGLAHTEFGGLDVGFNNAGQLGDLGEAPGITLASWQETLETNLTSAFLGAKYQLPAMLERGSGSLIFTSSFVGYTVGMPGMAAYAASKSGMVGLTKVLAAEYGPRGIRANALLPGGTNTEMARAHSNTPEAREFVCGLHALKRIARPEEIAQTALYLASDASSFTTGQAILVDGGVSINRT